MVQIKPFVAALLVVAVACSQLASVSAIAQLCDANANPVAPQKVRIESQKWLSDKQRVEVVIAFDNPTTEKTGCITAYTVGIVNDKNTQLGAKVSVSNAITNPIKHTIYAAAGTTHTIQYAEFETAKGKKSRTNVNLKFVTINAPVVLPSPAPSCDPNATPVAPEKVRIDSQKYDASKKMTEVVIAFDNPTTSKTGCIVAYTVSVKDSKGQALGAKVSLASPTTNPIKYTSWRKPGEKYTINYVETETKAGRKARVSPNLTFIANGPTAVPATTTAATTSAKTSG